MIIDQWNPSQRRYRFETFCYGPKSCSRYKAGPTRKVPGRKGMSWEEESWVDDEATAHRSDDEPYRYLLPELRSIGILTAQQLKSFVAKWREPTLIRAAREAERLRSAADAYGVEGDMIKIEKPQHHTTFHVTPKVIERAKSGVFYSHTGLTFTALQFESGERSPDEPMH